MVLEGYPMKYLPDPKDPGETITVSFDFSNITQTPTNPAVSISVRWGAEETPSLMKSGSPIIVGPVVAQKFTGGADLHDYNLKCLADTPSGDRVAVDAILAVRTRPIV